MSVGFDRPRAVVDCNVILQAMLNADGPSAEVLRLVEQHRVDLFLSKPVLREVRRVLQYPELLNRNPNLTVERANGFLQRLEFHSQLLRRVPHVFQYPRARQDEPYVDLAVASEAHYLVSRDTDLLSLTSGRSAASKRFRQFRPLLVVNPVEFLRRIGT